MEAMTQAHDGIDKKQDSWGFAYMIRGTRIDTISPMHVEDASHATNPKRGLRHIFSMIARLARRLWSGTDLVESFRQSVRQTVAPHMREVFDGLGITSGEILWCVSEYKGWQDAFYNRIQLRAMAFAQGVYGDGTDTTVHPPSSQTRSHVPSDGPSMHRLIPGERLPHWMGGHLIGRAVKAHSGGNA